MARPVALVTGASSGIGLALAGELAARGYDLAICSAGERLGSAAQQLRATGAEVMEVNADLGTAEGVRSLWEEVTSTGRELDIVCINAGVGVGGLFSETPLEKELEMVNLNCTGVVHLAKFVVQHMTEKKSGPNLIHRVDRRRDGSSARSRLRGNQGVRPVVAHSIRYELRDTGVSVTALQPGPTDTDFFHRAGMDNTQVGSEGKKESSPEAVARQGIEALLDGKEHIYVASMKTKVEGMLANVIPGGVKDVMHEKMARPKTAGSIKFVVQIPNSGANLCRMLREKNQTRNRPCPLPPERW